MALNLLGVENYFMSGFTGDGDMDVFHILGAEPPVSSDVDVDEFFF